MVVKYRKCLIEKPVVKAAVVQRPLLGKLEGGFGVILSGALPPQGLIPAPVILVVVVIVAPKDFHTVHANGGPALMIVTFAVTGGKILDVPPERWAQVVVLQFVSDSAPGGYSAV